MSFFHLSLSFFAEKSENFNVLKFERVRKIDEERVFLPKTTFLLFYSKLYRRNIPGINQSGAVIYGFDNKEEKSFSHRRKRD